MGMGKAVLGYIDFGEGIEKWSIWEEYMKAPVG